MWYRKANKIIKCPICGEPLEWVREEDHLNKHELAHECPKWDWHKDGELEDLN